MNSPNTFFEYTSRERRSLLIFISFIVLLYVFPEFTRPEAPPQLCLHPIEDTLKQPQKVLSAPSPATVDSLPARSSSVQKGKLETPVVPSYRKADPNQADQSALEQIGFPSYLAVRLIRYREKGGSFRCKSDIQKLYGMDTLLYQQLLPQLDLPSACPKTYRPKGPLKPLDINIASAEEWRQFRGIGPAISQRIVKFRDKLGGFYRPDQVAETYGLPDSVFTRMRPFLKLETPPKKLFINSAEEAELKGHPYLDYGTAAALYNYIQARGPLERIEDLEQLPFLKPEVLVRIGPYLHFEQPVSKDP